MFDHGLPAARPDRRAFLGAALLSAAGGAAVGQTPTERNVNPLDLPLDRAGVWNLHFKYRSPRIDTVDAIDKAGKVVKKTVWYMWFQVYNKTTDPQTFIPEFELVTHDIKSTTLDQPEPYIFEQLKKREDPTGALNLLTTISIAKRPVPPSSPDAIPRAVSGLAIWTDITEKAPQTNRFSVFVLGLSNGLTTEAAADGGTVIKRKALRIDFFRPTDDANPRIKDIQPDTALGPAEKWVYRYSSKAAPPKADADGK